MLYIEELIDDFTTSVGVKPTQCWVIPEADTMPTMLNGVDIKVVDIELAHQLHRLKSKGYCINASKNR